MKLLKYKKQCITMEKPFLDYQNGVSKRAILIGTMNEEGATIFDGRMF